jgi:hypothetical protein
MPELSSDVKSLPLKKTNLPAKWPRSRLPPHRLATLDSVGQVTYSCRIQALTPFGGGQ